MKVFPLSRITARSLSVPSRVFDSGFSIITCAPASRAATAMGTCREVGVQMNTASGRVARAAW